MKIRLILLVLLWQFVGHSLVWAQCSPSKNTQLAYQEIMALRITSGQKWITNEKNSSPSNLYPLLLDNYIDFMGIITLDPKYNFKTLVQNKEQRITAINEGKMNSPYDRYALAEIHLQWAFLRMKQEEFATAGYEIKKAYSLLQENNRLYPDFLLNDKGLGILHVLIGSIPEEYKWIASLVGLNGSVQTGVNKLNKVLNATILQKEYALYRTELLYYLTQVHLGFTGDEKALEVISRLIEKDIQTNPASSKLLRYCQGLIYAKQGKNGALITLLGDYTEEEQGTLSFPLLTYLKADALLKKNDPTCIPLFTSFIKQAPNKDYTKAAYQRMAWYFLMAKDSKKYHYYMSFIPTSGQLLVEEDKQAQAAFSKKTIPNALLLEARLLYDGGYYKNALIVLLHEETKQTLTNSQQVLEYYYRLGRIYDSLEQDQTAIAYYQKTWEKGKEFPYYYAANALLKMGEMQEKRGAYDQAKNSYTQIFSCKNTEYKNSIQQKATTALQRLKNKK